MIESFSEDDERSLLSWKAEANEFTTAADKLIAPIAGAANVAKRATRAIKKEKLEKA